MKRSVLDSLVSKVRRRMVWTTSAVLAAATIRLMAAPADGDPPFTYIEVSTRVVRPGQQQAVEDYYLKLRAAEAAQRVVGVTDIYAVAQGGRPETYVSMRTLTAWSDLDDDVESAQQAVLARAYGEPTAQRLQQDMAAASESVTNEVQRVTKGYNRWRLSPGGRPWPFMQVRRIYLKPGKHDDYLALIATMRNVSAQANAVAELRWQVAEGPGNVYGLTRYFRGWQERDLWEGETLAVLGREATEKWRAVFQGAIERTETMVLRRRADLSRGSTAAAAATGTRQ